MIALKDVGGYAPTYFFLTLVVAGIAQGMNRSGFGWWLLSLIFTPPLALFILVVFCGNAEPKKPEDESKKFDHGTDS